MSLPDHPAAAPTESTEDSKDPDCALRVALERGGLDPRSTAHVNIDFRFGTLCLVCETQTRNGREKLRRCAVDFRKVAVDFRGTGACETEVAQGPPAQLTKPCCDQKQKEFRTSWRRLGHPQLASKKSTVKNGDGRAGRGRGGFATPVIFYE